MSYDFLVLMGIAIGYAIAVLVAGAGTIYLMLRSEERRHAHLDYCPVCGGTGAGKYWVPCPHCHGTGVVRTGDR